MLLRIFVHRIFINFSIFTDSFTYSSNYFTIYPLLPAIFLFSISTHSFHFLISFTHSFHFLIFFSHSIHLLISFHPYSFTHLLHFIISRRYDLDLMTDREYTDFMRIEFRPNPTRGAYVKMHFR